MGNHLIDLTGVYDGRVIFYETMVTRAHLLSKANTCAPIKSPRAVAERGFYPTLSCVRHDPATGNYSVSMEQFVLRGTSPPEPVPQAAK